MEVRVLLCCSLHRFSVMSSVTRCTTIHHGEASTNLELIAYTRLQHQVGMFAALRGPTAAARHFCVGLGFAKYHLRKLLDPTYHNNRHGGARHHIFNESEQL